MVSKALVPRKALQWGREFTSIKSGIFFTHHNYLVAMVRTVIIRVVQSIGMCPVLAPHKAIRWDSEFTSNEPIILHLLTIILS
jgi:hypothetical protein